MRRTHSLFLLSLFLSLHLVAAHSAQTSNSAAFAPLEAWRAAVLSGDSAKLQALYSTSTSAQFGDMKSTVNLPAELSYWSGLKAQGLADMRLEIFRVQDPKPHVHVLALQVSLTFKPGSSLKPQYFVTAQRWVQEGDRWYITSARRTEPTGLPLPVVQKELYPSSADANKEIAEALRAAAPAHKRVLLVFGGDWCYDCHVLDEAFHSPEIAPTLDKYFEVVHVDIGRMDKNLDISKKYDVPLERGVPAVAVLDSDGKLLFSQKRGEFEAARSMATQDILDFLDKWKPDVK